MSASDVVEKLTEFSQVDELNRDLLLTLLTRRSRRDDAIATMKTVSVQQAIDMFAGNNKAQVKVSEISSDQQEFMSLNEKFI